MSLGNSSRVLLLALWCYVANVACVRAGFEWTGAGDSATLDGARGEKALSDVWRADQQRGDAGEVGWVAIPAGSFAMGSPETEPCRYDDEVLHTVTLTHRYEIGTTEVTQAEFQALMGYNPSDFQSCGATCPVETVNWHEAAAYCNSLSAQQGLARCYTCTGTAPSVTCAEAAAYSRQQVYLCPGYRLPTDAEWERAYRAATTTAYYSGANNAAACRCPGEDATLSLIGWYCGNAGGSTHPVAQKQVNAWGLYDMAGNVWEWCHDWVGPAGSGAAVTDPWGAASGTYRMYRGGSWEDNAQDARAASRGITAGPRARAEIFGFRCARTLDL